MSIHLMQLNEILDKYYNYKTPAIKEFKVLFNNGTTISLRWKDEAGTRSIKAIRSKDDWNLIIIS